MEKDERRTVKHTLIRCMPIRYVYLILALVLLMPMVFVSGCRRKTSVVNTDQAVTTRSGDSSGQAGVVDKESASEDGTSGGSGLSDLPLLSSLKPSDESDVESGAAAASTDEPGQEGQPSGEAEQAGQAGQPSGEPGEAERQPSDNAGQEGEAGQPSGGAGQAEHPTGEAGQTEQSEQTVDEAGRYNTKDEVALYIHLFGHLPSNYITKSEADELGWDNQKGNLAEVAPGMSIGGDRFGNYEKRLPSAKGRTYFECDINYKKVRRGAERIVFSNDGLVFYTKDHYETFEQLY